MYVIMCSLSYSVRAGLAGATSAICGSSGGVFIGVLDVSAAGAPYAGNTDSASSLMHPLVWRDLPCLGQFDHVHRRRPRDNVDAMVYAAAAEDRRTAGHQHQERLA